MFPSKLRILGKPYALRHALIPDMGYCWQNDGLIQIRTEQRPIEELDTVVHEVFHAILAGQGRQPNDKNEERFVRAIATGLTTVLADNPAFRRYLASPRHYADHANIPPETHHAPNADV